VEATEVAALLRAYGLTAEESAPVVEALRRRPEVDFMMRFELGLERPDPKRALRSACSIAGVYMGGGLNPLAPYMTLAGAPAALASSVVVTLGALALFGYIKGHFTGTPPLRSALQTVLIGGLAAGAAFWIARAIS
jgi:vacuolar iron transporter family protein